MRKLLYDFNNASEDCSKALIDLKKNLPYEITFAFSAKACSNLSLTYLSGLNPITSDHLVDWLFEGTINIKNLYGWNNSINAFALPLTYGSATDESLFMQIYQAGYFASERPQIPSTFHQVVCFMSLISIHY